MTGLISRDFRQTITFDMITCERHDDGHPSLHEIHYDGFPTDLHDTMADEQLLSDELDDFAIQLYSYSNRQNIPITPFWTDLNN